MRALKVIFFVLFVVYFTSSSFAQVKPVGVPFITNYTNEEYGGANQNFAVIQDNRGVMYFGNSVILEFDGTHWRQIYTPNLSFTYSFAKDSTGRIYVGAANGELGYLGADSIGNIKYISLADKIPVDKREFSRVRAIVPLKDEIVFVTPLSLYVLKEDTFKIIDVLDIKGNNRFISPFMVDDHLYIQEREHGIWEYRDGKLKTLPGSEKYASKWVTGMFPYKNDSTVLMSWQSNAEIYKNGNFHEFKLNALFKGVYTASVFMRSLYTIGLFSDGILITDQEFNVKKYISTSNGLQSNTVYSLYPDEADNVWAGLGNGISHININSPYSVFNDKFGLSGTTYTGILHDSLLYIGSSTGVFYMNWTDSNPLKVKQFKPIENSRGAFQVWKIDTIFNQVLCVGTSGFFYIEAGKAKYILEDESIRTFVQLGDNSKKMIAGGGNGLSSYEFNGTKWVLKSKIKNFNENCKHIELIDSTNLWVSNQNKGIFRVKLNPELDSAEQVIYYDTTKGLPTDIGNYVYMVNNRLVFATDSGIYKYDAKADRMIPDEEFTPIFGKQKIINLHQSQSGNIWFKEELTDEKLNNVRHWELGVVKFHTDSFEIIRRPFLKVRDNIHSISTLSGTDLLIGTEKGFVHYDMNYEIDHGHSFKTLLRKIETIRGDSLIFGGTFSDENGVPTTTQSNQKLQLDYEYNGLRFTFSALYFEEPGKTQYKFILIGDEKEAWSDWSYKTEKEYSNIAPGTYTFKVVAKNLYGVESEAAEYVFEVLPPWYQSAWAYLIYFILFVLFVWSIVQLSVRRVKIQKENLERIVEQRTMEIQQKNEELSSMNAEISRKNKDITSSINYAKRIQDAMLPLENTIKNGLKDYFILFKPRDIVSGDFYWYAKKGEKIIITAVDCTGHGVPGAFMSMIGSEVLTTLISKGITNASIILKKMNDYVSLALKQEETSNQDGMDMALCVIDEEAKTVDFAGAKNPLVYITDGKLHQIKGDKKGIGGSNKKFKNEDYAMHTIKYESPTWFYIFTDGFQDQFGGPNSRKFMIKKLKSLLLEIHQKPLEEQNQILDAAIMNWMEHTEQTDDILLIGFKL